MAVNCSRSQKLFYITTLQNIERLHNVQNIDDENNQESDTDSENETHIVDQNEFIEVQKILILLLYSLHRNKHPYLDRNRI